MSHQIHHIGLIPDGTRRWAKANSKSLSEAYLHMVTTIANSTKCFYEQNIPIVSLYLLSRENLKREPQELLPVLEAELYFVEELLPPIVEEYNLDVKYAGNLELMPNWASKRFGNLQTYAHSERKLFLCLAYSPLDELKYCLLNNNDINNIGSKDIISRLWVTYYIDMVIRTSGEQRLSNFLPLQSAYAELFFLPHFINDVTNDCLLECIEEFRTRSRRIGQ